MLAAVVLTVACGPKNGPIDETGGESSGPGTGTGTSTGEQPDPTTSSGETAGTSTASASSSQGGTAGTTTGEPDGICGSFCGRLFECGLDGAFDGCPCGGLETAGPKCVAAWALTADCFEAASCEVLETGEGTCWEHYVAAVEQCTLGEDGCEGFVLIGGEQPPGTCAFGEDCLDQPEKLVECEADTCKCTIGDVEVGTCPADNICGEFAMYDAKVAECCA